MTRLPDPEGSRAVLFGAAAYRYDELPDLPAIANNLKDLHAALAPPLGGFAAEHCAVLLDPPETVSVFNQLQHQSHRATDTLLVYFAGHGIRKVGGGLYLTVSTSQEASKRVSALDYDVLRELVSESGAQNKIVILDCCYSGRAIQGMSAAALAEQLDIDGACVLTSTAKDREALAPAGARHTTFTGELLHLLHHGVPGAGELLSLGTVAEQLRRNARLRGLPIPEHLFHGTTRHLALTRNPAAPATDPPAPPSAPPPPRPSAQHAHVSRALVLAGTLHTAKKDLAETVRKNWSTAADRYFQRMGTEAHPTESWGELRSWTRQFDDPRTDDVEGRSVLIDRYLTDPALPPDHKVLHLLRWLDPDGPVGYRGRPITYAGLARACLWRYTGGDRGDKELLRELSGQDNLLDTLAEFATLHELRGVQRQWRNALKTWQATDFRGWPPEVRDWAADVGPGALLAARLPQEHLEELRPRWQTGDTGPPDPSTWWYDRLLKAAKGRDTLLGRLIEAEWSGRAREEGLADARERKLRRRAAEEARERKLRLEQEAAGREQAEERRRQEQRLAEMRDRREREQRAEEEQRHRRQRELEWQAAAAARTRPAARALAALRALGLGLGWALPPLVLIWLTWWFSSYEFDAAEFLSLQVVITSATAMFVLVPRAARLGGAFRPRLRMPSSWLPSSLGAPVAGVMLLVYGLIGKDTTLRSGSIRADSGQLRKVGLSTFLQYVGRNSYAPSGWAVLIAMLGALVVVGCWFCGLFAGQATARRWEELAARARQEADGLTRLP
ncbi:caspase family protein [Streptomyces sp. NPDC058457]|uniref:caspase, EACC1-associated type n=1 Tax=Streptomyces sp. NPDC058457 TaxID=3346507 RepID=UPI0036658F2F